MVEDVTVNSDSFFFPRFVFFAETGGLQPTAKCGIALENFSKTEVLSPPAPCKANRPQLHRKQKLRGSTHASTRSDELEHQAQYSRWKGFYLKTRGVSEVKKE